MGNQAMEVSTQAEITNWNDASWDQAIRVATPEFAKIASENKLLRVSEEIEFATQAIQKSHSGDYCLQKCHPLSVRDAIVNVASIGLSLNPALGFAYLVPRSNKQAGILECCLDISYKGLIKIATDTGAIRWAKAELVCQNDEFIYNGMCEKPEHRMPNIFGDRGPVVGGYCIAKTCDGDYLVEPMSLEEMNAIQGESKGPVWKGKFGNEMRKKAIIKRASKTWPKTDRAERLGIAIDTVNQHEGIDFDNVIEGEKEDPVKLVRATTTEELPEFPEKDFGKFFPTYKKTIEAGKKTVAQVIEKLETKGMLSDRQKGMLENIKAPKEQS